jgi:hypothetical protein
MPLKVINGKAKIPCNRYRIADVTEGHRRIRFNDIGSYIVFPPYEHYKEVLIDYWGTPIDFETGKPLIQRGHEEACEWFCLYNLFFGDFGTGKITQNFWNEIKQNKEQEILAAQSASVRFKTRAEMNCEQRITFEQLPEPARLWLLRDECKIHTVEESHEEHERKHVEMKPYPISRITSSMISAQDIIHEDGVTGDTGWINIIPAGLLLWCIIVDPTNQKTGVQISFGTTPQGTDIAPSNPILPMNQGPTTITIDRKFNTATSIYVNHAGQGDTFNGVSMNLTFLFHAT